MGAHYDDLVDQLQDDGLRPYASDYQWGVRNAIIEKGIHEASRDLGKRPWDFSRSMRRLIRSAADRGYSPRHDQNHPTPEGQHIRGVSTLYVKGKKAAQWVKTQKDNTKGQQLKEFAELLAQEVPAKEPITVEGRPHSDSILTVYPIGDPHFGMLAWGEESGEDFDVRIAERVMTETFQRLIDATPASDTAIVLNLGDFFHADNLESRTRSSGHVLDTDTRWQKVMRLGSRMMMDLIEMASRRHSNVVVKNLIGNHDDQSSYALSLILDAYYRDNPRIKIDTSPVHFWYYKFGKNLIGANHGDKARFSDLVGIMASDVPKMWGETEHRYWYTGHIHRRTVEELSGGVLVESFRTTAPKDAYAASHGYRSGRDMQAIILDKEEGETMRIRQAVRSVSWTRKDFQP